MKYYIAENGQPAGPFDLKELLEHGLTVNSQVWNESMSGWTTAGNVPEVMNLLRATSQPVMSTDPLQQQQQQQQQPAPDYSAYQPQEPNPYQPQEQPLNQQPYYGDAQEQQTYNQEQQTYNQPQQTYNQPQYGQAAPQYGGQQPYYQQGGYYAQPQYAQPVGVMPADWKTANIIITILSVLCCCNVISLVTGIIGIVKSGNVRTLFNAGNQAAAEEAASSAKMWFYISLGILVLGIIVSTIVFVSTPGVADAFREGYENGYTDI